MWVTASLFPYLKAKTRKMPKYWFVYAPWTSRTRTKVHRPCRLFDTCHLCWNLLESCFATCWQLFGPRDCSSFENTVNKKTIKTKNMIHPNIHPLQCLTSLQGVFCVAPLSPLWTKRRQDSRSENLLNALEPASLGCWFWVQDVFFGKNGKNAAFWKKSNFWREQTQMQGIFDHYLGVLFC